MPNKVMLITKPQSSSLVRYGILDNQWVNALQVQARNSAGTGPWSTLITLGKLTSDGTLQNLILEPY